MLPQFLLVPRPPQFPQRAALLGSYPRFGLSHLRGYCRDGTGHAVIKSVSGRDHSSFVLAQYLEHLLQIGLKQALIDAPLGSILVPHGSARIDRIQHQLLALVSHILRIVLILGCLEADGTSRQSEHLVVLVRTHPQLLGDLVVGGAASQFLLEGLTDAADAVEQIVDVDGEADGAGVIGDGTEDSLLDPPRSVRGELESLLRIKLLGRPRQPDATLLDQISDVHADVPIPLGDAHYQSHVALDHASLRLPS
mmetsp:Transcript_25514/g.75168  ORF Transcript_25514/g.75168 Transcript_25514/m.75168 type:complete len:252 (-) Transcript_25514:302-1057(-)